MDLLGRQSVKDLREKVWSLDEFSGYFQREMKKEGNSEKFRAVAEAFGELESLQGQMITQESAMRMVKAGEQLKKACREYSDSRRNALSPQGRERLAVVDSLAMFEEDLNLDMARDLKVVRDLEGKTWEQAGSFKVPEITLGHGQREMVGAAVSQRMKMEYEGKKGFFTSEFTIRSREGYVKKFIEDIDEKQEPDVKKVLKAHEEAITARVQSLGQCSSRKTEYCLASSIGETWNQMGEKEKGRKELGRVVIGDKEALPSAAKVVEAYQERLKKQGTMDPASRAGLMEQMIEEQLGENQKKLKKVMLDNKDFFMGIPAPDPNIKKATVSHRYMKLGLIQEKAAMGTGLLSSNKKELQALDRLIGDGGRIHELVQTGVKAEAAEAASGAGQLGIDKGNELTSRNIASSRIAELLGIGDIIARSEKMTVHWGDQVMTGCFMEFAKGIDPSSKDPLVQRMLGEVEVTSTPELNKAMTTMEVFDFLCAQNDRHAANMFYQLSDRDENGKRKIIGLQGIDSDLAFGDLDTQKSRTQALAEGMEAMTFIDRQLAERVRALDRDTLEYAIGDLIPKEQIDMMMKRVERFQKHLKENMVEIDPQGWDLTKYDKVPEDKLDKEGLAYRKGVESIERSLTTRDENQASHKNYYIRGILQVKKRARDREARMEDNNLEAMQNMFQEKKKVSFKELQNREKPQKREPKMVIGQGRSVPKKEAPQRQM